MVRYRRDWAWLLAWAWVLGCIALLGLFGRVAADDGDNDDDDRVSVIVAETEGDTRVTEGGRDDTYSLALSDAPKKPVVIALSTDSEVHVEPQAVTFTADEWRASRSVVVSAVDDDVAEGPHTSTIRHTATSGDDRYDGLEIDDVSVRITDDDTAGVTVSPMSVQVAEGGTTADYQVVLASQPAADVTIRVTTDGETTVAPSQITITPDDWRQARALTVTAVDDRRAEGDHTGIISHQVSSVARAYDGIDVPDIVALISDNDVAGVSIAPRELDMVEGDAGVSYAVALESEPAGAVTIGISTDGLTSAGPSELQFTPEEWDAPRWVAVTVADDVTAQGTRVSEVRHSLESDDRAYDALSVGSVTVTVRDDERAEVIVTSGASEITARDETASFVLRLASRPTSDVMIPLSVPSNLCSLSPGAVRLTRDTWQAGVQVIVSANVAPAWTGEERCVVAVGPASSDDDAYDGLDPEDVVVTIRMVPAMMTLRLPLALRIWPPLPGTPELQPVGNPEGWGSYTLAWIAADRAKGYLLQEASDSGFAAAREVYAGLDLAYTVTGRGAARYFYRAAATNAWGIGAWSDTVAVDVRWEAEPNDGALTQANGPIMPGLTYRGVLAGDGDTQDYYWLEMGGAGRLEVWLDAIPAGQNDDLVLRDAALNQVDYSGELDSRDEYIDTEEILPPGRYYIQVYQRSGGGSPEPYALCYAVR